MKRTGLVLIFFFTVLLTASALALTADVSIRVNGALPNGLSQMLVGRDHRLEIWITNSAKIKSMLLGFELQNSGGFPYSLVNPYGTLPYADDGGDPPIQDYTVCYMQEHGVINNFLKTFGAGGCDFDVDKSTRDTIFFGGTDDSPDQTKNLFAHLTSTLGYSVMVRIPEGQAAGTFCVRPVFVPPVGEWKMDAGTNIDNITHLPSGATNPDFQGGPTVSSADPGIDWAHAACFARVERICGDANSDDEVNISDAYYIIDYLGAGGPDPDFAEDADDYDLITIHDAAYLAKYFFGGGALPTCPPSHGKYTPFSNADLNLTYSTIFPAHETQYSFRVDFQRSFSKPIYAFDFPLLIRVDGEAPANLTVLPHPFSELPYLEVQVNQAGAPNGSLVIVGRSSFIDLLSSGTDSIVTIQVTMPTSSPNPRPITFQWVDLPPTQLGVPNNYPMIVDEDLDGWIPTLNGIAWGDAVGFYALRTKVDAGMPVFFTGLSTVGISAWDWDFGDMTLHASNQNPIHTYSSTGVYTVTLVATLTGGGTQTVVRTDYIHVIPVKADFMASPRYGSLDLNPGGLPVQFTDASTSATSWLWSFGDPASGADNISALQSPTHTYANPGFYRVQLTASNAGSSDTKIYLNCIRVDAVATPDLQVSCYGPERVRRGFHKELSIVVTNIGPADAIGTTLTLDLALLSAGVTFEGSVPPPNETPPYSATVTWNLPTITWDPTQLDFDDYHVKADLYVDPGVSVGTDIQTIASVSPAPGEVVLTNNTFGDSETVVASCDPNDKSVQPRGCGSQRAIKGTERLDYLIQFENKPSATTDAFYVLVVDTLDPNLDWATLEIGPSSKDDILTFDFNPTSGEMVWFFDGYNLPPNVIPPEGEGFVSYSISPKPGLSEGALIKNLAHIRFDYESWLAAPATGPLQLRISNQDLNHNGIIDVCEFTCGDANGDGKVNISDAVYLIAYIFSGGSAPSPLLAGDANCNGTVNISDAVYLIAYIFSGGAAPCAECK